MQSQFTVYRPRPHVNLAVFIIRLYFVIEFRPVHGRPPPRPYRVGTRFIIKRERIGIMALCECARGS